MKGEKSFQNIVYARFSVNTYIFIYIHNGWSMFENEIKTAISFSYFPSVFFT